MSADDILDTNKIICSIIVHAALLCSLCRFILQVV